MLGGVKPSPAAPPSSVQKPHFVAARADGKSSTNRFANQGLKCHYNGIITRKAWPVGLGQCLASEALGWLDLKTARKPSP